MLQVSAPCCLTTIVQRMIPVTRRPRVQRVVVLGTSSSPSSSSPSSSSSSSFSKGVAKNNLKPQAAVKDGVSTPTNLRSLSPSSLFVNRGQMLVERHFSTSPSSQSGETLLADHRCNMITAKPGTKIGFITDIEGSLSFWKRYIKLSKILYRDPDSRTLKLNDGCLLVFGGDMVDRGTGDLRVVQDVLDLKARYPDRVYFILGNRDVNKLRLISELSESALPDGPYWVKEPTGSLNQVDKLQWMLKRTMGCPNTFEFRRFEIAQIQGQSIDSVSDTEVARSFISNLKNYNNNNNNNDNGDDDDSGGDDDRETNRANNHWKLLEKGHIALKINDVLFVHGAVDPSSYGYVPPPLNPEGGAAHSGANGQERGGEYSDKVKVGEWLRDLEAFKQRELEEIDYGRDSKLVWGLQGGYDNPAPGSRLMQYGMGRCPPPNRERTRSVIYNDFLSEGAPKYPNVQMCRDLIRNGVSKIASGHKPHGICTGDTSYSAHVLSAETGELIFEDTPQEPLHVTLHNDSFRSSLGCMLALVIKHIDVIKVIFSVMEDGKATRVEAHGVLHSGDYFYIGDDKTSKCHDWIGRCTKDDWWVKGCVVQRMPRSSRVDDTKGEEEEGGDGVHKWLLTKSTGFKVWNKFLRSSELEKLLS
eukprot:jgi/Bigna1/76238/fgenesh1_pg.40_\